MKKKLEVTNKDYSVTGNGAYISQREVAKLIGMDQSTVSRWVQNYALPDNLNQNNQLNHICLQEITLYASLKQKEQAIEFLGKLLEAGALAYIHYASGYEEVAIRLDSSEAYKANCKRIADIFTPGWNKCPYIKCARIAQKATANYFGLLKAVPKEHCTTEMLEVYDRAHDMAVGLYEVLGTTKSIKHLVYERFQPLQLGDQK